MKPKVAILFGGKSPEHEVSLKSATNIYHAVDKAIFDPVLIGIDKSGEWRYNPHETGPDINLSQHDYFSGATSIYISRQAKNIEIISKGTNEVLDTFDVAFPIIHGPYGEDGTLQGFLKTLDIPFAGPATLGSAIGMDKDVTKRLLRDAKIPVAAFYTLHQSDFRQYSFEEISGRLKLPLFVKPANAGSSVGVSKVTDRSGFEHALREAFRFDNKVLVEEAIKGKEVECAVLGNESVKASIVGEIVPTKDFYSYDAKYISPDGAKLKIPAEIDEKISDEIRELAVKAFKTICCEGMARVDFFLGEDNRIVLNEINTLPGFTEISMYPKLWEHTGIPYRSLITELINLALERHKRDSMLEFTNG